LQCLLHLVEFEGFDHRLNLLHRVSFPRPAGAAVADTLPPTWPR
jgi:hypothetical protein